MDAKKTQGFFLLLIFVWLGTFLLNDNFTSEYNSRNLIRYCSMFGIIGIGAMFVIVTGGIDLSIGSTIGMIGASLVLLLRLNPVDTLQPLLDEEHANVVWFFRTILGVMCAFCLYWLINAAIKSKMRIREMIFPLLFLALAGGAVAAFSVANSTSPNTARIPCIFFLLIVISMFIGLMHGVLITKFELQPFVVTLAGLLYYRGVTRWLTTDKTQGLTSTFDESLRLVSTGEVCTVSTLMMIGGGLLALFALSKLLLGKGTSSESMFVQLAIGSIVGLIGSSRFWNGWEFVGTEEALFSFGLDFSTWETVVSDVAAARPGWLMRHCWVGLIPAGALMFIGLFLGVRSNKNLALNRSPLGILAKYVPLDLFWMSSKRQTHGVYYSIVSIAGLLISAILIYLANRFVNGESNLPERTLWWAKTIAVFGSLALVMISISRLGKCISMHGNSLSRILFPICGLLVGLSVLGRTEMATTMVQMPFFILMFIALVTLVIFEKTVYGRYSLAIGNNEDAAKYSGINTQEVTIAAYVLCSMICGIAAIVFMLDFNSVSPSGFGSFYELYAIAAVVLGGCSLRGGEANVVGVLLGASIMRILANAPDMIEFPKTLDYTILGLVILIGVLVDDRIRKQSAKKAMATQ